MDGAARNTINTSASLKQVSDSLTLDKKERKKYNKIRKEMMAFRENRHAMIQKGDGVKGRGR